MAGALSGDWDAQVRRGVVASVRQELGAPVSIILGYAEMLIEDAAQQDLAEFADDLRMSKQALENLTGAPVLGFRAPSFSLVPGVEWAFDVLLEEGYRYDSSIFPIRRRGYGYPGAPADPYLVRRAAGTLAEYPLATTGFGRIRLPAAGGGYLRQLPFALIRRAFANAEHDRRPATFYVHPWELDPDQPRVPVSLLTRARHYRGLSRTLPRVERLLSEFRFTTIASHLPALERTSA